MVGNNELKTTSRSAVVGHVTTISDVDVNETDNDDDTQRLIYPPCSIQIFRQDLDCLNGKNYINDNIIHFYLSYIMCVDVPYMISSRIQIFDSILYHQILKTYKPKIDHDEVIKLRQWYTDIDIFRKDYLLFPICKKSHWQLILVCFPGKIPNLDEADKKVTTSKYTKTKSGSLLKPGIVVFDSLGDGDASITRQIRDFLDYEWRFTRPNVIRKFTPIEMEEYRPKLPKQPNLYDCGLYMLMYCKHFLSDPDEIYSKISSNSEKDCLKQMKKDVQRLIDENSREKLKQLIIRECVNLTEQI